MMKNVINSMKNEAKKPIDKKRFIEMVYDFGASGDKTIEKLNDKQKDAIRQAWATFDAEDSEEDTDKKFGDFFVDYLK